MGMRGGPYAVFRGHDKGAGFTKGSCRVGAAQSRPMSTHSTTTIDPVDALKDVHRGIWASGEYAAIADHIAIDPPTDAVRAAGVQRGDKVLDVATGTGNAALQAAVLGADVTGLDLVPELLAIAAERAADAAVPLELVTGDAEALPFDDASYDRVTSVFGIQFAPRHQVVADELVRVTRPGGTIALVNWTPAGLIGRLLKIVGGYMPAPPAFASPPPKWGDEEHVRALFAEHDVEITVEKNVNDFRFPTADAMLSFFEERYGPLIAARRRLEGEGTWGRCRRDIHAMFTSFDTSTGEGYVGSSEYAVITIRKTS